MKENDADGDRKISNDEAPDKIKRIFDRMDKNQDGFIEESEVGRSRGGSRGGAGGGRPGGAAGGGGGGGGGGRPAMPADGKAYIKKYDKDGDGKVSKEELKSHPETPESWKSRLDSFWSFMDTSGDGMIDEAAADAVTKMSRGGGGRPGGGRPGGGQ